MKVLSFRRFFQLLEKRERFAFQTVLLTAGLMVTQLVWEDIRFIMVIVLSAASYLLTAWSLKEDINGIEWFSLFILPVFFTASVSLFYYLLPERWIFRITIAVIFAVGTYAILLVENIYNVAAQRSIQLLRAAQSVGLLTTLIIVFLSSNIIYSLRLIYHQNASLLFFITFILSLQSLWSINLEPKLGLRLVLQSLITGFGVSLLSFSLSFWPVQISSFSLGLASSYYCVAGIFQQSLKERLFSKNIKEYTIVFLLSMFIAFITTRWG